MRVSMRIGEILIGVTLLVVCVAVWVISGNFEMGSTLVGNKTLSPSYYPRLLAVGIAICAVLLICRNLSPKKHFEDVTWGRSTTMALCMGAMAFQVISFEELGFIPSIWIGLTAFLVALRVSLTTGAMVATGFVIFVYFFFIRLLQLQLPQEFLPSLLG